MDKFKFSKLKILIFEATVFIAFVLCCLFFIGNLSAFNSVALASENYVEPVYYVLSQVSSNAPTTSAGETDGEIYYRVIFVSDGQDSQEMVLSEQNDLNSVISLIRENMARQQLVSARIEFCADFDSDTTSALGECVYAAAEPIYVTFSDVVFSGKIKSTSTEILFKADSDSGQSLFYADGLSISNGAVEVLSGSVKVKGACEFTLKTLNAFESENLSGNIILDWSGDKVIDETVILTSCTQSDLEAITISGYTLKFVQSENGNSAVLAEEKKPLTNDDGANKGLSPGEIAGIAVGAVAGTAIVGTATGFSISWFGVKKRSWSDLIEWIKKIKNSKEYKAVKKARKIKKKIDKQRKKEEKKRVKEAKKNGTMLY